MIDFTLVGYVGMWVVICFGGIWLVRREQAKNKEELESWKQRLSELNGKDRDSSNR